MYDFLKNPENGSCAQNSCHWLSPCDFVSSPLTPLKQIAIPFDTANSTEIKDFTFTFFFFTDFRGHFFRLFTFFVVVVFSSAIKHITETCYASVYIFSLNFCILFSLFKSCHDIIPYQKYYEACKYDVCYKKNDSMACASVEAYAQLCGQKSICVDWRDSAELNGLCGKRGE